MYCAVVVSTNTVIFPCVTVVESLVQVTVVAGPPVEIQVRVNSGLAPFRSESTVRGISPEIISPIGYKHPIAETLIWLLQLRSYILCTNIRSRKK